MNQRDSPKWAIAIHGGAGSDPSKWTENLREDRVRGLQAALKIGVDTLCEGRSALDAVEQVIRTFEDDANFNAGRGAELTESGRAELDASIMDGATASCGAVASVRRVKNPISVARLVMTRTPHVLLVGKGADKFAQEHFEPVTQDYFIGARDEKPGVPHYGTVGCVVLDRLGNLAAGTSTGGTSKKLAGRVGDSPIIGAGTYASKTCAVSGTGIGEEYIRGAIAYDVDAQMRYAGRSLESAINDNIDTRLPPRSGGLIAVSSAGQIVMRHNTAGMNCGAADSLGRFEVSLRQKTN